MHKVVGRSASLYIRLSREAGDTNLSLSGMESDCRALAADLGLDVYAVHIDNGKSGAIRNRPEFTAWLNDARQAHVGTLIASHSDQLTREGVNAAALVFDVVEGKDPTTGAVVRPPVRLATVDGLDSERDPDGFRWRFLVEAEVARGERKNIVRRNIATKRRLKSAGRFAGGAVPYGCHVVERPDPSDGGKVGKFLERQEAEAVVLEEVASRLIRGDTVRSCLRWLNSNGYRTRRGFEWQRPTLVSTLLSDPSKAHVFNAATYRALSERLEPKRHGVVRHNGGRPAAHLIAAGLGRCGGCGGNLTTAGGRPKPDGTRYPTRYTCMGKSKGYDCPGGATINAVATDAEIERRLLERFGEEPYSEFRVVLIGGDELEAARQAYDDAQTAFLEDTRDPAKLAALHTAEDALKAAQARPIQRAETLHLTGETYAEHWAKATLDDRRRLLASMLDGKVTVHPGKPKQGPGRGKVVNLDRIEIHWFADTNP